MEKRHDKKGVEFCGLCSLVLDENSLLIPHTLEIDSPSRVPVESPLSLFDEFQESKVGFCLSPENALIEYPELSAYERAEIWSYPEIYYVGCTGRERYQGTYNSGLETKNVSFLHVVGDHIAYRYEIFKLLGNGTSSKVVEAFDWKSKTWVALKCIKNLKKYYRMAEIEIEVLTRLNGSKFEGKENVVTLMDHFKFRGHYFLVFEALHENLLDYLLPIVLPIEVVKSFARSILRALHLIHSEGIIHTDLKPENIMLHRAGHYGLKLIDFGTSCFVDKKSAITYFQSRFYRAPEVIMELDYGTAIDMWSFGCIVAELITGRPLFPGEDEKDQLGAIMEVFGEPPPEMKEKCRKLHRDLYSNHFRSDGTPRYLISQRNENLRGPLCSRSLAAALDDCQDRSLLDFLAKCLTFDADSRMTPSQAYNHVWLAQ